MTLFKIVRVQELTNLRCHTKRVHAIMEAPAQHYSEQDITASTDTELRPGSSLVTIVCELYQLSL